jgi:hypothetical protein
VKTSDVLFRIGDGRDEDGKRLLFGLGEPNETRLGLSRRRPKGRGIGPEYAIALFDAMSASEAVKTGFLTALEESELMIRGISFDRISDLVTNVTRSHLVAYTADQCKLHGIAFKKDVPLEPTVDPQALEWQEGYVELPVAPGWKADPFRSEKPRSM